METSEVGAGKLEELRGSGFSLLKGLGEVARREGSAEDRGGTGEYVREGRSEAKRSDVDGDRVLGFFEGRTLP